MRQWPTRWARPPAFRRPHEIEADRGRRRWRRIALHFDRGHQELGRFERGKVAEDRRSAPSGTMRDRRRDPPGNAGPLNLELRAVAHRLLVVGAQSAALELRGDERVGEGGGAIDMLSQALAELRQALTESLPLLFRQETRRCPQRVVSAAPRATEAHAARDGSGMSWLQERSVRAGNRARREELRRAAHRRCSPQSVGRKSHFRV